MGRVFLSYAREDKPFAQCVARTLEGAGHDVWWDRHIDSGEEFSAQIEAELDKADAVLVAWSKPSVKSRWVRDEASVGGDTGRLVPVSIDGSLPPMGFRQFQTLDLSGWKGSARDARTAELIRSVESRLKSKAAAPQSPAAAETARPERQPRFARRTLVWGFAAAVLLLLVIGGAAFWLRNRASTSRGLSKPTITLLPFTTASADPELRDVAAQARDSMSHTLPQSGIPVRLTSAASGDRASGGDFLVSGDVSRSGKAIVAIVRVEEAAHGVTVYSRRFEGPSGQGGDLSDRIGAQMADFFDGPTLLVLDKRHPMDPTLMAELLADSDDYLQTYQSRKRVAAQAPDDPNALIGVAFFTGFVLSDLPRAERPQAVVEARRAAEKGLKLAPGFGDTYATWCLLHSDALLAQCEDQLRAGAKVDPDAPYLNGFLADQMGAVGRLDEATELTRLSYTHNRFNNFKIGDMLRTLEFTGDTDGARDLYQQGARWWPEYRFALVRNRILGLLERADFEAIRRLEEQEGAGVLGAEFPKTAPIAEAVKSRSIPALRRECSPPGAFLKMARCMIAFAAIGDIDAAYAVADKLFPRRLGRNPQETEQIWLDEPAAPPLRLILSPGAAPMRRDPRFLQIAQRVGLADYWRLPGRGPDFCQPPHAEPICARLAGRR